MNHRQESRGFFFLLCCLLIHSRHSIHFLCPILTLSVLDKLNRKILNRRECTRKECKGREETRTKRGLQNISTEVLSFWSRESKTMGNLLPDQHTQQEWQCQQPVRNGKTFLAGRVKSRNIENNMFSRSSLFFHVDSSSDTSSIKCRSQRQSGRKSLCCHPSQTSNVSLAGEQWKEEERKIQREIHREMDWNCFYSYCRDTKVNNTQYYSL